MFNTVISLTRRTRTVPCVAHHAVRRFGDTTPSNVIHSPHGDCELPNTTVVQRFFQTAGNWPDKVAMECGITGRKYTYDQVRMLSRRFSSTLMRMGFKRGDVFGMVLPNIPEFPIALFGASGIGMPVTIINPMYTTKEMANQCSACGVSVLIGVQPMASKMLGLLQENSSIRRMILIGGFHDGFASFEELLNDSGDLFNENINANPCEDIFVLPNSSGTTGPPKTVMITHSNILANMQQALHPDIQGIRRAQGDNREIYIGIVPFFHSFGLCAQLLTSLESGGKVVTLPKFEAQSFLTAIYQHKPTVLYVAPPLIAFLASFPGLKMDSFQRLNLLFSAGAAMGTTLASKVLERFQGFSFSLREGYGVTEASPATHFSPPNNVKIGSVGAPLPRTKCKVINIETGEALGANQPGELCIKGPQVMKGYLNNPEATKQAIDSSGWLHTGDIAYYDEDGDFFVVDRLKELIKVKGSQVSPTELEDLILRHPAVADVAVIGVPDDYAGELPRAYVVKKPGTSLNEEELKSFLHSKVAPYKQLKGGVHFVESIPKSHTGKTLRRELRARV